MQGCAFADEICLTVTALGGSVCSSGWPPQPAAHERIAPKATDVPPQELTLNGISKVSSSLLSGILENVVKMEKELPIKGRLCSVKLSLFQCPLLFQKLCKDLGAYWEVAW